ncbi:hypothetical protein HNV12_11660 [Methanococcoides sp. SA1]|nr:hypothetical protein [Methanococcoides sp. SA1]
MGIMEEIDLKIQKLQSLEKSLEPLYAQKGEYRTLKDEENLRKIWTKIRKIDSEIHLLNLEVGRLYEKEASLLILEEKLPILLRAFEYYKLSSYSESVRALKEAKKISKKLNKSNLENLCSAQIVYIECKELDNEAEKFWYKVIRSEIKEQDNNCIQLSIKRDKIIKKLKDALPYAQESNSFELVVDYYTFLSWNLYRRCDRNKFISEIESYHRKAAVILECLAWQSYPINKENSREYLRRAGFQYNQAQSPNDRDRIVEILVNSFELTDFEYFLHKSNNVKTFEEIENLETLANEKTFDEKKGILSFLKMRKADLYANRATENVDDLSSFFVAAEYYEECQKDECKDSEMGSYMGDSLFQKSRGNLRLAINNKLLSTTGKIS